MRGRELVARFVNVAHVYKNAKAVLIKFCPLLFAPVLAECVRCFPERFMPPLLCGRPVR